MRLLIYPAANCTFLIFTDQSLEKKKTRSLCSDDLCWGKRKKKRFLPPLFEKAKRILMADLHMGLAKRFQRAQGLFSCNPWSFSVTAKVLSKPPFQCCCCWKHYQLFQGYFSWAVILAWIFFGLQRATTSQMSILFVSSCINLFASPCQESQLMLMDFVAF